MPVYIQVEQLIEQLILKRGLSAHELLPGVSVLAKQLSIAPLTVQKAYRRLQERGLIYSIAGKGTFVADASGQQFVGILLHQQFMLEAAQMPTLALLCQALCEQLAQLRIPVRILTDTSPTARANASLSPDIMSMLEQGRPIGVILPFHHGSASLFDLADSRCFPVIGVGIPSSRATARIRLDHDGLVAASLRYLRERGITEPGLLWLDENNSPAERRSYLRSVEQIARTCSTKLNPDWIIGVHQASDWAGYHAFNHLCSLPKRPQGLIVLDDVIGQGVHMGILARQIRVPEDMVMVVQTNEESPIVFPQEWQQCGYSLAQCGAMVVETLQKVLAGETVPSDLKCPSKWHGESVRSPWNISNVSIRKNGRLTPLFQSGRQALEPIS